MSAARQGMKCRVERVDANLHRAPPLDAQMRWVKAPLLALGALIAVLWWIEPTATGVAPRPSMARGEAK